MSNIEKSIFKESTQGGEAKYLTEFTAKKEQDCFHFNFQCFDSNLFSAYQGYNKKIYEGDVCEIFISTEGGSDSLTEDDTINYYEIEIAPNGSAFFAQVAYKKGKISLTFQNDSLIYDVKVDGNNYTLDLKIPFSSVNYKGGDVIFNAYRIETIEKNQYLMALNPTLCPSFHTPKSFIKLV